MTAERTNADRANDAETALAAHAELVGNDEQPTAIVDLLTDLMHLCDEQSLNFDNLLGTARNHHSHETGN